MSLLKQFEILSEYNLLMNQRLYDATATLTDDKISEDRGAFFKSILGTLNHIVVGDTIWLKRFSSLPSSAEALAYFAEIDQPTSLDMLLFEKFDDLRAEREKIDEITINWIAALKEDDLSSALSYNSMIGTAFKKELGSLINHYFLHQVHHRGQATTLLSQYGVDFGDTDIIEIMDDV